MYLGKLLFAVQSNVFISFLWFLFIAYYFFSDAADKKHSYLVEIPVKRSIFECIIKKSVPRSLQLRNIVIFKNRNM